MVIVGRQQGLSCGSHGCIVMEIMILLCVEEGVGIGRASGRCHQGGRHGRARLVMMVMQVARQRGRGRDRRHSVLLVPRGSHGAGR